MRQYSRTALIAALRLNELFHVVMTLWQTMHLAFTRLRSPAGVRATA
jgi:hypothetical protein